MSNATAETISAPEMKVGARFDGGGEKSQSWSLSREARNAQVPLGEAVLVPNRHRRVLFRTGTGEPRPKLRRRSSRARTASSVEGLARPVNRQRPHDLGSMLLANDEHWAVRVVHALIRHRADHQAHEPAQATRADHQQARAPAGLYEHL